MYIHMYFDVVIIGGGIAGLYAARRIQQLAPNKRIMILEKSGKSGLGGRAGNELFYGTELAIGAGVGRKHKDHRLLQLLKQTKVQTSEFEATREYFTPFQPVDIDRVMRQLKSRYKMNPAAYKTMSFKEFFIHVLGETQYRQFVVTSGYTDYERADVYETLYKYGMDDNTCGGWTAVHVPWHQLVERLYTGIGKECFKFSCEVTGIHPVAAGESTTKTQFQIRVRHARPMYCEKVVIATTISATKRVLFNSDAFSKAATAYNQIHGQPFLMVYAKFDKKSSDILKPLVKTFTVVSNRLQKLIPMNPDKGVYMIAYTDNAHATALQRRLENTRSNCDAYAEWVEEAVGITGSGLHLHIIAIKSYYWSEGTHYYEPLGHNHATRDEFIKHVQNPHEGVAVVGEAVSRNQGWVEGALESVDAVITKGWLA